VLITVQKICIGFICNENPRNPITKRKIMFKEMFTNLNEEWDSKSGIFVDTKLWKASNGGKQPKGKGFWWYIGDEDDENLWQAPFNLTYARSKKEAIKKALENGVDKIILAP
jgi:hypothetical protein